MKRVLPALLLLLAAIAAWFFFRGGSRPDQVGSAGTTDTQSASPSAVSDDERKAPPLQRSAAPVVVADDEPASRRASRAFALRGRIEPDPRAQIDRVRVRVFRGAPGDRALDLAGIMGSALPGQEPKLDDLTLATRGTAVAEATLRPDGRFTLDGLELRDLRVTIDDDFYGLDQTVAVHASVDASEIDLGTLAAHCGALVRGRVLGIEDPGNATVDLALDANPMDFIREGSAYMARAMQGGGMRGDVDAEGSFRFRAVWPTPSATLRLDHETAVAPTHSLSLGAGETHEVVLLARRGASLRVRVTDPDGAPLAGVTLIAIPADVTGQFAAQRATRRRTTADDGTAVLTALDTGKWSIIARQTGFLPSEASRLLEGDVAQELELQLDRGAAVSGIVVDSQDAPIAGAHVGAVDDFEVPVMGRVSSMVGAEMWAQQVTHSPFVTDEQGKFRVTGIPPGRPATVAAWHSAFSGALANGIEPGASDVRLVMSANARAHGRVVDDHTGEPVIEFDARTVETMALVMERPTGVAHHDPESSGSFRFDALPPRKTTLRISAEGFTTLDHAIEPVAEQDLDLGELRLLREASLRGRVLDAEGRGIGGASVSEFRRGVQGNPMVQMFTKTTRAVSSADGSFELTGLRLGAMELKATHGEFASGRSRRITLEAGQTLEGVDITLAAGGTLRGRITFGPGQSPPDWQVFATLEMQAANYGTKPGSDGSFSIEHLDPGRYDVQVMNGRALEDMQTESRTDVLAGRSLDIMKFVRASQEHSVTQRTQIREGETTEIEIDVSDLDDGSGELSMDVTVGNKPLESGLVEAQDAGGTVAIGFVQRGVASFRKLQPGPATFQVRGGITMNPIGAPQVLEIAATSGIQRLRLDLPGGSIEGRVIDDESGEAIAKSVVRLVAVGSGKDGRGSDIGFALSDDEGRFSFRGLAEGRFAVYADDMLGTRETNAVGRIDDVVVGAGEERTGLLLRAHRGAGIRIEVVDDLSQPVSHARTLAVAPDGSPLGSLPFALTDDRGTAELAGLPGGPTRVVAWAAGLAPGASVAQTLDERARADFRVVLSHGPETSLQILDADGNPLPHANLSMRFAEGPWLPAILLGRAVDAEGRIELGPMPSTTVEFAVNHPRASYVAKRAIGGGARASIVLRP